MNKYEEKLYNSSLKYGELINKKDIILSYIEHIINNKDDESKILLLKNISKEVSENKENSEIRDSAKILKDDFLKYLGYISIQELLGNNEEDQNEKSLIELLEELQSLIGLENVKNKIKDLIIYQRVQQLRLEKQLIANKGTMHMAFIGNPGTGKTTVARIVGHIYKKIGLLSKGHFLEVSRTDLIAGYQGQTALKVKKIIERAKGGVLFIDEAYSITENDHTDSYGKECLTELTKALEDYRDDLVVIVAGYTEPMRHFFESNPGLKSRFNTFVEFQDYTVDELTEIFLYICDRKDYLVDPDGLYELKNYFEKTLSDKDENFSNARFVRNIYDEIVMKHSRRIIEIDDPTKEDLMFIKKEDFNFN